MQVGTEKVNNMKKLENKIGLLKQEGGFTLIEMLIVVAIIGILVAIAIPALSTSKEDAQAAKRATVVSQIETAKQRYALKDAADDPNLSTNTVALADLSKYILINGVPATSTTLVQGTGRTFAQLGLGTYPNTAGVTTAAAFTP